MSCRFSLNSTSFSAFIICREYSYASRIVTEQDKLSSYSRKAYIPLDIPFKSGILNEKENKSQLENEQQSK